MFKNIIFIIFFSYSKNWFITYDLNGNALLQENNDSYPIILSPNYHPINIPKNNIEIQSSGNNKNFNNKLNFETLYGFSNYGFLDKEKKYECSNGLEECIHSCCLNGRCVDNEKKCEDKKNDVKKIYLLLIYIYSGIIPLFILIWLLLIICPKKKKKDVPHQNKSSHESIKQKEDSNQRLHKDFNLISNSKSHEEEEKKENEEKKEDEEKNSSIIVNSAFYEKDDI